jgi:hypothetical protein
MESRPPPPAGCVGAAVVVALRFPLASHGRDFDAMPLDQDSPALNGRSR